MFHKSLQDQSYKGSQTSHKAHEVAHSAHQDIYLDLHRHMPTYTHTQTQTHTHTDTHTHTTSPAHTYFAHLGGLNSSPKVEVPVD